MVTANVMLSSALDVAWQPWLEPRCWSSWKSHGGGYHAVTLWCLMNVEKQSTASRLAGVRTASVRTGASANVFRTDRSFDQEKAVSFILAESRRRCTPIYNDGELGPALPFPGSYT